MSPEQADQRIILSRSVIARWEAMGGPGNPAADNLRLVRNEIQILEGIAMEHTVKAEKIARIIGRYRALEESLKLMLD